MQLAKAWKREEVASIVRLGISLAAVECGEYLSGCFGVSPTRKDSVREAGDVSRFACGISAFSTVGVVSVEPIRESVCEELWSLSDCEADAVGTESLTRDAIGMDRYGDGLLILSSTAIQQG